MAAFVLIISKQLTQLLNFLLHHLHGLYQHGIGAINYIAGCAFNFHIAVNSD